MSRSKHSSASPPEFFADRCLGKTTPQYLRELGWLVHVLADHFPDDGEAVSDPEWVEYGLVRGWSLLTQDLRIATQSTVTALLATYRGLIFCLHSAELPVRMRAARFHSRGPAIHQHVKDGRTGFYVIGETGPPRRKRTAREVPNAGPTRWRT